MDFEKGLIEVTMNAIDKADLTFEDFEYNLKLRLPEVNWLAGYSNLMARELYEILPAVRELAGRGTVPSKFLVHHVAFVAVARYTKEHSPEGETVDGSK